jgi:hypothetical protein
MAHGGPHPEQLSPEELAFYQGLIGIGFTPTEAWAIAPSGTPPTQRIQLARDRGVEYVGATTEENTLRIRRNARSQAQRAQEQSTRVLLEELGRMPSALPWEEDIPTGPQTALGEILAKLQKIREGDVLEQERLSGIEAQEEKNLLQSITSNVLQGRGTPAQIVRDPFGGGDDDDTAQSLGVPFSSFRSGTKRYAGVDRPFIERIPGSPGAPPNIGEIPRTGRLPSEGEKELAKEQEKEQKELEKKREQHQVDMANARVELTQRQDDIDAGKIPRPLSFRFNEETGGIDFGQTSAERAIIKAENTRKFQDAVREKNAQDAEQKHQDANARASRQAAINKRTRDQGGIPTAQNVLDARPIPSVAELAEAEQEPETEAEKQEALAELEKLSDFDFKFLAQTLEPGFDINTQTLGEGGIRDADAAEIRRLQKASGRVEQIPLDPASAQEAEGLRRILARRQGNFDLPGLQQGEAKTLRRQFQGDGAFQDLDPLREFSIGPGAAFPGGGVSSPNLEILANFIEGFDFTQPDKFDLPRLPTFTPTTTGGLQVQQEALGQLVGLQGETQALEEQLTNLNERRQQTVDRLIPQLSNLISKRLAHGSISAAEEAQVTQLRAELNRLKVEFDQEEEQLRTTNAQVGARNLLTQTATENPIGFSALQSLGRIPEKAGAGLRGIENPFLQGLQGVNFGVPEGGVPDRTSPKTLFGGALPTLGALGQIGQGENRFLESVLSLTGTGAQDFARQSAGVTPGTTTPQTGRLFRDALPRRNR